MNETPIPRSRIVTDRLVLRPTKLADADRAFAIQSDWDIAKMLRMATFPPDRKTLRGWFSDHEREWVNGSAYRFAVEFRGIVIGIVDIDEISGQKGELGYWFDRAYWGQGFAFEAARAAVDFAFRTIALTRLQSGHAADNGASGTVLSKLGFRWLGTVRVMSLSRGEPIQQQCFELDAAACA